MRVKYCRIDSYDQVGALNIAARLSKSLLVLAIKLMRAL